jgi:hypothetical protein
MLLCIPELLINVKVIYFRFLSWAPTAPLTISPGGSQIITVSIDWGQLPGSSDQEQIIVQSNDTDMSPYPNAVFINATKGKGGKAMPWLQLLLLDD